MKQYICTVCGYIHETEGELPDDFKCPICGAGKDAFVLKKKSHRYRSCGILCLCEMNVFYKLEFGVIE